MKEFIVRGVKWHLIWFRALWDGEQKEIANKSDSRNTEKQGNWDLKEILIGIKLLLLVLEPQDPKSRFGQSTDCLSSGLLYGDFLYSLWKSEVVSDALRKPKAQSPFWLSQFHLKGRPCILVPGSPDGWVHKKKETLETLWDNGAWGFFTKKSCKMG